MLSIAATILAASLNGPAAQLGPLDRFDPFSGTTLAGRWDDLSPDQQDKALRNYDQYRELPADKRRRVDERYEKWQRLRDEDKERFRHKHKEYRGKGLLRDD